MLLFLREDLSEDELDDDGLTPAVWQNTIIADLAGLDRDPNAPNMESSDEHERFTSFRVGGLGAILPGRTGGGSAGGAGGSPVLWSPGI